MRVFGSLIVLLAASCTTADRSVDSRASAEAVIAAERAFAARHQQVSIKKSFAEYAAADGVALTPQGTKNVQAFIATWPDRENAGFIQWWPNLAGIARSGDLGFTTGPASYGGGKSYSNYFTVWKKQPDGSWKWLIDQGTSKGVKPAAGPEAAVTVVPVSTLAPIAPARAEAGLRAAEKLADDGFRSAAAAAVYASDVRVLGWQDAPQSGPSAISAMLRARGPIEMQYEGGGVSEAGDFGWTYGYARWSEGGQAQRAPWLRVWQRRSEGWRILVENIAPF